LSVLSVGGVAPLHLGWRCTGKFAKRELYQW